MCSSSSGRTHAAAALAVCVALGLGGTPAGQAPGRVLAIGDVHGNLDGLTAVLRATGLIDASSQWTGGPATLVQTGDVLDRGAGVRAVLDLLMALERDAAARGGRVLNALGNHEVMNVIGEIRDATPEIFASFGGADAAGVRERGWRDYERLQRDRARARPGEAPSGLPLTRDEWLAAYPPGCLEYRAALGPGGRYGKWLRSKPIAVQAAASVFMHAGPDPTASQQTVSELNARAAKEIDRYDRFVQRLVTAKLALPWFRLEDVLGVAAAEIRWTNARLEAAKAAGTTPDLSGIDVELVREAAAIVEIGTWSLLDSAGPLWYRGFVNAPDEALAAPVASLLQRWQVSRLVVAHTPTRDRRVHARWEGRVFVIDTGMLTAVYKGQGSALELLGGGATAYYSDGTHEVLRDAAP